MKRISLVASTALLALQAIPSSDLAAATFEILFPIGDIYGFKLVHVSNDGSTVLGTHAITSTTYLWKEGQGVTNTWSDYAIRRAISGDGNTIVTSYPGENSFVAEDASYDASVLAGYFGSYPTAPTAIINGQQVDLGKLFADDTSATASAVSSDGTTIVGTSYAIAPDGNSTRILPFRWTAETGMTPIALLPNPYNQVGRSNDVSADGSVVVGSSSIANRQMEAFRWTESGGTMPLGDLPGGFYDSDAFAVSGDGRVVVGRSYAEPLIPGTFEYDLGTEAFIWTEAGGMQDLREVLISDYGLDIQAYRLRGATGISSNGNIIVGVGGGLGNTFAWRVNLVPEPSAFVLLAFVTLLSCFTRMRDRAA